MDLERIRANRAHWNATSDSYQRAHDPQIGRAPKLWGSWSIPETEVDVLGAVEGLRVLELGCGAAQWATSLDAEGADVVGLDLSERQLEAARRRSPRLRLVQAAAEILPFADESFDLVLSDHGAIGWGDPALTVPEVARVLATGGRLVCNTSSPWLCVCHDDEADRIGTELRRSYFDLATEEEGNGALTHPRPYGEWIRLFRASRLQVEDLIELRPDPRARSTYYTCDPLDWHSRWPAEMLWVTTKAE